MTGNDAFAVLELEPDKFFVGPYPRPMQNPMQPSRPWETTDKPCSKAYRFESEAQEGCQALLAEAKRDFPSARYLHVHVAFATLVPPT